MIPKIIHNIWIQGYQQLPEKEKQNHLKLKKLNPDWEFIIWDNNMIIELLKKYPKIYNVYKNVNNLSGIINNNATRSDIARYIIMKVYGGLYYDFDFECISSFDNLFDEDKKEELEKKNEKNEKEVIVSNSKKTVPSNNSSPIINSSPPISINNFQSKINFNKSKIYIVSSKIDFLDYIYPFSKPKYCACFMAFEKNHPIWESIITKIIKAETKYQIGSALDVCLQENENNYNIIILEKVNGHYKCKHKDTICYTKAESSWNFIRPTLKFLNCYYKQILLFILAIVIIIIVERITNYNVSIYGSISAIPGLAGKPPTIKTKKKK